LPREARFALTLSIMHSCRHAERFAVTYSITHSWTHDAPFQVDVTQTAAPNLPKNKRLRAKFRLI
jgi:hypothetical protein